MKDMDQKLPERERQALERNWQSLKRDVRLGDISGDLIEGGVLKVREWEDLKRKHSSEFDRTEEFLFILQRRSQADFVKFLECLKKNGLEHLATKLSQRHGPVTQSRKKGGDGDPTTVMLNGIAKKIKHLEEQDQKKQQALDKVNSELNEYKEQDKKNKSNEKRLAEERLQKTNQQIKKLSEALSEKDNEIRKLREVQEQHKIDNERLIRENTNLKIEREDTIVQMQRTMVDKNRLKLAAEEDKVKLQESQAEKKKIQKLCEQQAKELKKTTQENDTIKKELIRERSRLESALGENRRSQSKIERLERENTLLSASTYRESDILSVDNVNDHSPRRSPSGISDDEDDETCLKMPPLSSRHYKQMTRLLKEQEEITKQIKSRKRRQLELQAQILGMERNDDNTQGTDSNRLSQVCNVM